MEAALAADAPLQFEELGSNLATSRIDRDREDPLAGADHVVRLRMENHRVAVAPIEGHAILVEPTGIWRLTCWVVHPAPAHGPGADLQVHRAAGGVGPGHRAARRRGVRRQGRHRGRARGGRRRRSSGGPSGHLDGDPQRGDALHARPRAGAVRRARAHRRGPVRRAPAADGRRLRRLRRIRRRLHGRADPPDGAGDLRRTPPPVRRRLRPDQHLPGRRVPGRGPARGGRDDRAPRRRRRGRAGTAARGAAAAQLHPAGRLPVHDPLEDDLRQRRLRPAAARGAPDRRRRRGAGRAAATTRGRRPAPAGHRDLHLRRDHRLRWVGVRLGPDPAGRVGGRHVRHLRARPGPRDVVLDDRRGPARDPAVGHHLHPVGHRSWSAPAAGPAGRGPSSSAAAPSPRPPTRSANARSPWPPGCWRRRPRTSRSRTAPSRSRASPARASAGPRWRPTPTSRTAASAPTPTSPSRGRPSPSARTSRSSRSTPRPGWSTRSGTSPSTTAAGCSTR